jgi:hypothetical protein
LSFVAARNAPLLKRDPDLIACQPRTRRYLDFVREERCASKGDKTVNEREPYGIRECDA